MKAATALRLGSDGDGDPGWPRKLGNLGLEPRIPLGFQTVCCLKADAGQGASGHRPPRWGG